MEALDQARRADPQLRRQRGEDLELRRGHDGPEAELGGGPGHPGQEQRLGLVAGHPGQARPVAVDEADPAVRAALGVDRDAGRAQRLDVAMDRPLGDLELGGELGGGQLASRLEEEQHRDESGGAHAATIASFMPEGVMFGRPRARIRARRPRSDLAGEGVAPRRVAALIAGREPLLALVRLSRASTSRDSPGPASPAGSGRHRPPRRRRARRRSAHPWAVRGNRWTPRDSPRRRRSSRPGARSGRSDPRRRSGRRRPAAACPRRSWTWCPYSWAMT